ncbi:hypothetical protein JCM16303_003813 [Sporobolomyces ruberrimus]
MLETLGSYVATCAAETYVDAAARTCEQAILLEPHMKYLVSKHLIAGKRAKESVIESWAIYVADCATYFSSKNARMKDLGFTKNLEKACEVATQGMKPINKAKVNLVEILPEPSKLWEIVNEAHKEKRGSPSQSLSHSPGHLLNSPGHLLNHRQRSIYES